MSNHSDYGTITTDTDTATANSNSGVTVSGWATMTAHLDSGSGTWTWQFKGPDGEWRNIFAGSDNITVQSYTASNMVNVFFGTECKVRGNATAGSTPVWDWQIFSNPFNRGS